MRGLSDPDAFPSGDLVLRQVLADDTTRTPGATTAPARAVAELAEAWRPWRAYAALHLWTEGSEDDKTADRSN